MNSTAGSNTEMTAVDFLLMGIGISTTLTGLLFAAVGLIASFTGSA